MPERVRAVLPAADGWLNPGGSSIVDPDGKLVAGPVLERQELVVGEVVPTRIRGPRFQLDVTGHYARPDVFRLTVDRSSRPAVHRK